jgi:antitoxin (DNA-binding transcriptional repressor) of toxin-antitoxin stability system
MEDTITTTDLRESLTRHLEDVDAGSIIRVTHYNRPTAVLIPPDMFARLIAQHGDPESW